MASKRQISIALPRQVQVPDALNGLISQVLTALLGGDLTVTEPTPPPVTITPVGGFHQVGSGPSGCWCLKWVEDYLGFGSAYRGTGYLTADQAMHSWTSLGFAVSTPAVGDFVTFAPASSNSGAGHIGIVSGPGTFTSLWCDGRVMDGSIADFQSQNGTHVTAYLRVPHP